jgi:6-phosphogluconolactonase
MAISKLKLPEHIHAHAFASADKQAIELAAAVADALQLAITERGVASLVVSGGKSPISFFKHLSCHSLDWARVAVSLADERWVPVSHTDSNEGLVRARLLQGAAAKARFIGLYQPAETVDASAQLADIALSELPLPIDVLVLGMGEDGHTASLFPNSINLQQALDPTGQLRCLPMRAPSVPHQRLSLTLPVLSNARNTFLLLQGESKIDTLREALAAEDVARMPIRAFLASALGIYWCP